jgi:uncharacterized protein YaaQ
MQLLLAIVQDEDADQLCRRLTDDGFRATRISSAGGFLARGNVTFVVGVDDAHVEEVIKVIRATCHTRRSFINALPWGPDTGHLAAASAMPLEVQVGGATVFDLPVRRLVRLRGGGASAATDDTFIPDEPFDGQIRMDMALAIMQSDDAGPVSQALLSAGFRLTRINTAGAFLRRGNATLLIGVERAHIDDVLHIIQANCKPRTEATGTGSNLPMYAATVFIVAADSILHV